MAAKKKSIGNQTRPAKKGESLSGTGSHDPRAGRGGRKHEWDIKRLRDAKEYLAVARKGKNLELIKKAEENVDKHQMAANVSAERKKKEDAATTPKRENTKNTLIRKKNQNTTTATPSGTATPKGGNTKNTPKKIPTTPKGGPSSWKRFKDAIGSFFKKKPTTTTPKRGNAKNTPEKIPNLPFGPTK